MRSRKPLAGKQQKKKSYSPFDYKKNCRIILPATPRTRTGQGRLDLDYLANMVCWCTRHVEGGTLVLFTSHFDLRYTRTQSRIL